MDGTTPQQPTTQSEPQTQPADPAPTREQIEQEILQDVFGGKFQSRDAAKKGYWDLNNYASQAYQELNQRVNPQTQRVDPFEELERDSLVKRDTLSAAIEKKAAEIFDQRFGPVLKAYEAHENLSSTAPEYLQNESAIRVWLTKTPQLKMRVDRLNSLGAYDEAAQLALREWRAANPPGNPGNEDQKRQAALLASQQGQGQNLRQQEVDQMQQNLQAAIQYGHLTGDKREAYSRVFPDFQVQIPPHLADQLNLQRR